MIPYSADRCKGDSAYLDMFRANRARFDAVRDLRRRSDIVGIRAVCSAEEKSLYRTRETPMLDECARVLAKFGFPMTTLPSPAGGVVAPSFVSSKNSMGGMTGVMSFAVRGNFREWLYCPCLQDVFRNFFDRATGGAVDVVATKTPGTWLSAAVAKDGRELLVMVNNLAGEPRGDIRLEFSRKWRGGRVTRLDSDASWADVGLADDAFVPANGFVYEMTADAAFAE